jgi:hypothetical protein
LRKRGSITPLGSLLTSLLQEHPVFAANPLGDWQDIVGEQGAAASRPVSLKDKTLLVVARDAVWKHHLEMSLALLLSRINGERKEPLVERLVIRVGELPESQPALNPNRTLLEKKTTTRKGSGSKKRKAPKRSLTPEEKALLKNIRDPELRSISRRLLQYTRPEDETGG